MLATLQKNANEVLRAALLCCAVLACSEDKTIVTPPSAGSGGSGGVSGSGNSGSGGSGSGGAAAGATGASGSIGDERDASTDAADAAPLCCDPSPQPDCCMVYGGRGNGVGCGVICDGMPLPNAGWQLGADSYGCPVWIEPPPTNECCGCAPPDSGI